MVVLGWFAVSCAPGAPLRADASSSARGCAEAPRYQMLISAVGGAVLFGVVFRVGLGVAGSHDRYPQEPRDDSMTRLMERRRVYLLHGSHATARPVGLPEGLSPYRKSSCATPEGGTVRVAPWSRARELKSCQDKTPNSGSSVFRLQGVGLVASLGTFACQDLLLVFRHH